MYSIDHVVVVTEVDFTLPPEVGLSLRSSLVRFSPSSLCMGRGVLSPFYFSIDIWADRSYTTAHFTSLRAPPSQRSLAHLSSIILGSDTMSSSLWFSIIVFKLLNMLFIVRLYDKCTNLARDERTKNTQFVSILHTTFITHRAISRFRINGT